MSLRSKMAIGAFVVVASGSLLEGQVPFLRGDVNDDGRVSIADAHYLSLWKFGGGPPPACVKTADANDDGSIIVNGFSQYYDYLPIFYHAICCETDCGRRCEQQGMLAEPLEAPGEDPTPDKIPCERYTGAAPSVTDAEAKIEILDATCPGGNDALAVVKVRISHSRSIGGYSGAFDGGGLCEKALASVDVAGAWAINGSPRYAELNVDGLVHFGYLDAENLGWGWPAWLEIGFMPPVEEQVALKVYLRLAPGTPAGTYPLTMLEAEMADSLTGHAILPAVGDGILTITEDVTPDAVADLNTHRDYNCPARETTAPAGPEDVQAAWSMAVVPGNAGSLVQVPVWIECNAPLEGFTFALGYGQGSEELRRTVHLERVLPMDAGGGPWEEFDYEINPALLQVYGKAVFRRGDPAASLEPGKRHQVLLLELQVDAGAPDGRLGFYFHDFFADPDHPGTLDRHNHVLAFGQLINKGRMTCFEQNLTDGGVILGKDTTAFLRGDANMDGTVSFADAVMLMRDARRVPCADAADANDDGGINYADAVRIFQHLFVPPAPATVIPEPFLAVGTDPTLDPLFCDEYRVAPSPRTADLVRLGSIEAAPGEAVQVPIHVTSSSRLQALQLLVRYDPNAFVPTSTRVELGGGVFEGSSLDLNIAASNLAAGRVAVALSADLFRDRSVPAGPNILVGKLTGYVPDTVVPGEEVRLELLSVEEGSPPRPDTLRTEIVEIKDAKVLTLLPELEPGVIRIVDRNDPTFLRGDTNGDLAVNISDPILTLAYLFLGGPGPSCEDAADADDSGRLELTDAVFTLGFLFGGDGARPLPPPYPERGRDGEWDALAPCP